MPRVVIADKDFDEVHVLAELLELRDISVVGIGYDGRQAVKLYKEKRPDVVIMGLTMPEFDGFFGLQKIRRLNKKAKVIIVAPDIPFQRKQRLEELGASAIISKKHEIDHIPGLIHNFSKKSFFTRIRHFEHRTSEI